MIISFPLGNISCFSTSHSIDTLPGPVRMRLADIDSTSKGNSYPPTNPFGTNTMIAINGMNAGPPLP